MWLLLATSALALDLDVTVHPPKGPAVDVTFHDVVPGPVPGALLADWFDGKQCRVVFDIRERKDGGYAVGMEIAELRTLEDGTIQAVVAKNTSLKLADDKRKVLKLDRPLSDGEAESWSIEVNSAPSPTKKLAPSKPEGEAGGE